MRNYYWSRIQAIARFKDTKEELPVQSINMTYTLNSIPTCDLNLNTGISTLSGARQTFSREFMYREVEVVFTGQAYPDGIAAPNATWPEGAVVIFDGIITGFSLTKNPDSIGAALRLVNKFFYLHGSPTVSRSFSNISPSGMDSVSGRVLPVTGTDARAGILKATNEMLNNAILHDISNPLLEALHYLASSEDIWDGESQEPALKVLGEINPINFRPQIPRMQIITQNQLDPADLALVMAEILTSSWLNSTIWEALRVFCSEFFCFIVPTVNYLILAPLTFQQGGNAVWRILDASEYTMITDSLSKNVEPTRAVKLIPGPEKMATGQGPTNNFSSAYLGYYAMPDALGATRFQQPPVWLKAAFDSPTAAADSRGIKARDDGTASSQVVIDAFSSPDILLKGIKAKPMSDTTRQNALNAKLGDLIAKLYLLDFLYSGNKAAITGRLRFDIAPGSTVAVRGLNSKDMLEYGIEGTMFGCVSSVNINILCGPESGSATTSFELVNIRSADDQVDTNKTHMYHPMFPPRDDNVIWLGCPLIDMTGAQARQFEVAYYSPKNIKTGKDVTSAEVVEDNDKLVSIEPENLSKLDLEQLHPIAPEDRAAMEEWLRHNP